MLILYSFLHHITFTYYTLSLIIFELPLPDASIHTPSNTNSSIPKHLHLFVDFLKSPKHTFSFQLKLGSLLQIGHSSTWNSLTCSLHFLQLQKWNLPIFLYFLVEIWIWINAHDHFMIHQQWTVNLQGCKWILRW